MKAAGAAKYFYEARALHGGAAEKPVLGQRHCQARQTGDGGMLERPDHQQLADRSSGGQGSALSNRRSHIFLP